MTEQIQVLRRIAERGLQMAQKAVDDPSEYIDSMCCPEEAWSDANKNHQDLWQHMLDEIERLSAHSAGK